MTDKKIEPISYAKYNFYVKKHQSHQSGFLNYTASYSLPSTPCHHSNPQQITMAKAILKTL